MHTSLQSLKLWALGHLPQSVLAPLKRIHYAREFRAASPDDEPEFQVIRRLVRPGDRVVDVGAHIGSHTKVLALLVGTRGAVYAFEPVPLTYRILAANVTRAHLEHVRLHHLAVSDRPGRATLAVPRVEDGADGSYFARIVTADGPPEIARIEVPTDTLDHVLFEHLTDLRFIKIDVEGHELQVVRGALELIRRFRPAMMIELSTDPDTGDSPAARLTRLLADLHYEPWLFADGRLKPRCEGDRGLNYFFLQRPHVAAARELLET